MDVRGNRMYVENKHVVLAGALLALAVAGGAVWYQHANANSTPQAQFYSQPGQTAPIIIPQANGADASLAPLTQPVSANQQIADPCGIGANRVAPMALYTDDGYYGSGRRPVQVRQAVYAPPVQERTTYVDRDAPDRTANYRPEARSGRSVGKSAAIVAGTAAVGAAIGGVAAGGKGAALGALSGGGAGFLYDRLTHKHR